MNETYEAREIEIGYHPDGFRIDKTATPMDRYTSWRITADGRWTDPKPVCFDSMPERGWLKVDRFDWQATSSGGRQGGDGLGAERSTRGG